MFGKGISASGSLLDAALKFDIIGKSGSWYSYGEERIGQGRENAKLFLESNPDISEKIEKTVRERMFPARNSDKEGAEKKTPAAAEVVTTAAPEKVVAPSRDPETGDEDNGLF